MENRKLRIVFADDDGPLRDALVECMRDAGVEVHPCSEGSEAVRLCSAVKADVVLLDLNMVGIDGYEAARVIRRSTAIGFVRLVALTGLGTFDVRQRAFDAGFDDFLTKPIAPSALVEALWEGYRDRWAES
jgi:CheY-like chemotaxis protein